MGPQKDKIKALIQEGNVREAIDLLAEMRQAEGLSNSNLILLQSRLSRLETDYGKGIVAREDYLLELNKLTDSLILFIQEGDKPTQRNRNSLYIGLVALVVASVMGYFVWQQASTESTEKNPGTSVQKSQAMGLEPPNNEIKPIQFNNRGVEDTVNLIFNLQSLDISHKFSVPLDINVQELMEALDIHYKLIKLLEERTEPFNRLELLADNKRVPKQYGTLAENEIKENDVLQIIPIYRSPKVMLPEQEVMPKLEEIPPEFVEDSVEVKACPPAAVEEILMLKQSIKGLEAIFYQEEDSMAKIEIEGQIKEDEAKLRYLIKDLKARGYDCSLDK